jgi:hypothetical protein
MSNMKTGRLDGTQTGTNLQVEVEGQEAKNTAQIAEKKKIGADGDRVVQGGASASQSIRRASGEVDPANRDRILDLAASALERITETVTSFHGMDHVSRDGRDNKYDGAGRPAAIPKVVARVSQDLGAIKEAAALFSSGQIDPGSAAAQKLGASFDDFLNIHAAMVRAPDAQWKYENEGSYPKQMETLRSKMAEIWSLSGSVIGEEAKAKAERQRLDQKPADYAPVTAATGRLWETAFGYYAPGAGQPHNKELNRAVEILKDNVSDVSYVREAGRYSIALSGVGTKRFVSNRGEIPIAKDEVIEKACRLILKETGLDDSVPIHIHHPGATPMRREEAWSVLAEAFATRDFIDKPKSGSDYYLRRWSPNLDLGAPRDKGYGWVTIPIFLHGNVVQSRNDQSMKDGTPDRIASDVNGYLWTRGFKDIHVEVLWSPRPLTQKDAEGLVARLDAARGDWKSAQSLEIMPPSPLTMTPTELMKHWVTDITIENGVHGAGREVVVHGKPAAGIDKREQLKAFERAVREILDDPASQGTPVRIQFPSEDGTPRTEYSMLFGEMTSTDNRSHNLQRLEEARAKVDSGPYSHIEYAKKDRREKAEKFGELGSAQAALVAEMKKGGGDASWEEALQKNLSGYFLGEGQADPSWRKNLEKLSIKERAEFLEIALRFVDPLTAYPTAAELEKTESLHVALSTWRRLEGRVALEHESAKNRTQVPEYMAHTDAIFRERLGGPALEYSLKAIEDARKV